MKVKATIDIKNIPARNTALGGYEVVTIADNSLWHYGLFPNEERAREAVEEDPKHRFMVEVTD